MIPFLPHGPLPNYKISTKDRYRHGHCTPMNITFNDRIPPIYSETLIGQKVNNANYP